MNKTRPLVLLTAAAAITLVGCGSDGKEAVTAPAAATSTPAATAAAAPKATKPASSPPRPPAAS